MVKETDENFRVGDGTPGPGRPKGSLNRTTKAAKEAIALAAEGLGGTDRLVEWAKEDPKNEAAFWTTIYPKLIPIDVKASGSLTVAVKRIELVALGNG
jgi:hypothetical protein